MKKLVLAGVLAASVFLNTPTTIAQSIVKDGKYDNHAAFVDESKFFTDKIVDSVEKIENYTTFKVTYEALNGQSNFSYLKYGAFGSGVVIKKEDGFAYILTNDHAVNGIPSLKKLRDQSGNSLLDSEIEKSIKIERVSRDLCIRKGSSYQFLEEVISNADLDVSLIKVKDSNDFKAFPYKLGNSDNLESADFVYIIGSPLGIKDYVLDGNVSKTYIEKILVNPWQYQVIKNDKLFMIGCDVQPGYSGAPVIAIKDGEYELIGIVRATYTNRYWDAKSGSMVYDPLGGYGVAIKINPIMEWVDKYFKSLKKDKPEKNQRPSGRGPAL